MYTHSQSDTFEKRGKKKKTPLRKKYDGKLLRMLIDLLNEKKKKNKKKTNQKLDEIGFMKCYVKTFQFLSCISQQQTNLIWLLGQSTMPSRMKKRSVERKYVLKHIENAWIRWTITLKKHQVFTGAQHS